MNTLIKQVIIPQTEIAINNIFHNLDRSSHTKELFIRTFNQFLVPPMVSNLNILFLQLSEQWKKSLYELQNFIITQNKIVAKNQVQEIIDIILQNYDKVNKRFFEIGEIIMKDYDQLFETIIHSQLTKKNIPEQTIEQIISEMISNQDFEKAIATALNQQNWELFFNTLQQIELSCISNFDQNTILLIIQQLCTSNKFEDINLHIEWLQYCIDELNLNNETTNTQLKTITDKILTFITQNNETFEKDKTLNFLIKRMQRKIKTILSKQTLKTK